MRILLLLLCILLAGCVEGTLHNVPKEYICNEKQMRKVEVETLWCKQNTDYLDTYCYSTAIMRNCEKRK